MIKVVLFMAFCVAGYSAAFGQRTIVSIPDTRAVTGIPAPKPSLTLVKAIRIAKNYIEKNRINIIGRHLTYGSLIKFGSPGDLRPAWQLFWTSGKPFDCDNIEIIVFDDTHLAMQKAAP